MNGLKRRGETPRNPPEHLVLALSSKAQRSEGILESDPTKLECEEWLNALNQSAWATGVNHTARGAEGSSLKTHWRVLASYVAAYAFRCTMSLMRPHSCASLVHAWCLLSRSSRVISRRACDVCLRSPFSPYWCQLTGYNTSPWNTRFRRSSGTWSTGIRTAYSDDAGWWRSTYKKGPLFMRKL